MNDAVATPPVRNNRQTASEPRSVPTTGNELPLLPPPVQSRTLQPVLRLDDRPSSLETNQPVLAAPRELPRETRSARQNTDDDGPTLTLPTIEQMAAEHIEQTKRARQRPLPPRDIPANAASRPMPAPAQARPRSQSSGKAPSRVEPVWFTAGAQESTQPLPPEPAELESPQPLNVEEISPSPASPRTRTQYDDRAVESPPEPGISGRVEIPLVRPELEGQLKVLPQGDRVTLIVQNKPLGDVLHQLAQIKGLNVAANLDTATTISVTLNNVAFEDALNAVVAIAGCTWVRTGDIILVTKLSLDSKTSPQVQGRRVQVIPLSYVDATDVEAVVKGLLSPVGQIFVTKAAVADKRKTQEVVVVEDVAGSLERVCDYIAQIDQPPRQVQIEAHVLQVELKDEMRHGVNWQYLTTISGRDMVLKTQGFANPFATPGSIFSLDGDHLDVLLELLQSTAETKTLASPKIVVANGQEAKIQIGAKFGYFVTTTTQTSTMQNVNFLETGVILTVTPQISSDGQVLMMVKPEVSTGRISPAGLPETETTTAQTTVMLPNGGGMVIGGLIKELDNETQDKVPLLGDIKVIGRLFQRRVVRRQRNEIIIALVPRIVPYHPDYQAAHDSELSRATTPILYNGLNRAPRPGEPKLPDAFENPRSFRLKRVPDGLKSISEPFPYPLEYYFPAVSEECPDWYTPANQVHVPSFADPIHQATFELGNREPNKTRR